MHPSTDASARRPTASQNAMAGLRPDMDRLILDIWDEVEFAFRKAGSPASIRRKSREYGVVYDTRPS
ncbi:MAG: hypothetical protein JO295_01680 [Verrucomicrobia bacterium]|nr:hypothetical protein [Verrucomicrobiota bacterium]